MFHSPSKSNISPTLTTATGNRVNLYNLHPDDIVIEDIAHSLACLNRFNGHTKKPINVAQHSVYVSRLCSDTPFELQGLLHDASEAYLGDVTKWLKHTPEMAAYRELEDHVQKLIYRKFWCPEVTAPEVEYADKVMVRFEGRRGYGPSWEVDHPDYPTLTGAEVQKIGNWSYWKWRESREIFLFYFRMLTRAIERSK